MYVYIYIYIYIYIYTSGGSRSSGLTSCDIDCTRSRPRAMPWATDS